MSLIPERPLLFYPQLAVTLGLEGAVMVQVLKDLVELGASETHNGFVWVTISAEKLSGLLPFWSESDIQRISSQLRDQGILLIGSTHFSHNLPFRFAINQRTQGLPAPQPPELPRHQARNPIPTGWQPEADLLAQLAQYAIPRAFALDQVGEFVTYWSERNEPKHSWGARFLKHVLRLWRDQQSEQFRQSHEIVISPGWRPSIEAMEILTIQAGINANFVDDAIAEFILYWQERGIESSTWNSRFIQHVKRQWARFTNTLKSDLDPRPITADWQPDENVFDILAMANIDRKFGEELVAEFVLYWQDNGQALSSWNTKFLQYTKRQWAYLRNNTTNTNHETQQRSSGQSNTRNRDIAAELSDRSWAS